MLTSSERVISTSCEVERKGDLLELSAVRWHLIARQGRPIPRELRHILLVLFGSFVFVYLLLFCGEFFEQTARDFAAILEISSALHCGFVGIFFVILLHDLGVLVAHEGLPGRNLAGGKLIAVAQSLEVVVPWVVALMTGSSPSIAKETLEALRRSLDGEIK